jgi:aminodeoxyfutalosine deaminase
MFATTLSAEYEVAHDIFGLSLGELAEVAKAGVRSSLRSDAGKRELLAEIDAYETASLPAGRIAGAPAAPQVTPEPRST